MKYEIEDLRKDTKRKLLRIIDGLNDAPTYIYEILEEDL